MACAISLLAITGHVKGVKWFARSAVGGQIPVIRDSSEKCAIFFEISRVGAAAV